MLSFTQGCVIPDKTARTSLCPAHSADSALTACLEEIESNQMLRAPFIDVGRCAANNNKIDHKNGKILRKSPTFTAKICL